jgi:glycosyltransferase involved in cell wall biosynthesis
MDGRQVIVQCLQRLSNRIGEPSVVMFRREPAARGFNEQLRHWLDLDLWFHLLAQAQFAYLAEPLSAFRRHAMQQSHLNLHSGVASVESVTLFKHWFARLGLPESKWNQALFAQIHDLRRNRGTEAEYSRNEMMRALGRDRYFLLWCGRKIMRPLQKVHKQASRVAARLKVDQSLDSGGRASGTIETDRAARKRILVIDTRPPTPEQDSGSLRMFHLLQILRQMEMEVTFVADNPECNSWTGKLESLGIKILYRPRINNLARFLKLHSAAYDDIILSRLAVAEKYIDLIKKHAPDAKVFFDTVDLHYLRMEREAQTKADDALKRLAAECKINELAVAQKTQATLVVSPVEKQILRRECPQIRIEVVSNIHEIPTRGGGFSDRRGLLFIGGFDHSPNVDAVLFFVRHIFPLVERTLPDVRFHVLGSNVPEEIGSLANLKILVHGFVPDVGPFFNACRISVAPLRFGAGIKGKINQSHAYGVPVVATSVAVEGMQLEHGQSALVADTPETFAEAIRTLYTNEHLWNRLSQNGIKHVEKYFSYNSARAGLERLFNPGPIKLRDADSFQPSSGQPDV